MFASYNENAVFPKFMSTPSLVLDYSSLGDIKFFVTTSSLDQVSSNNVLDVLTESPFFNTGRPDRTPWDPPSPPSTPALGANKTVDQLNMRLVEKLLKNVLESQIESQLPLPPAPEDAQFRWDNQARRICDPTTPLSTPILPSCESFTGQPAYLDDLLTAVEMYDRRFTKTDERDEFGNFEDTPIRLFIECEL